MSDAAAALARAQHIFETITVSVRRANGPLMNALMKTFLPPFLALVLILLIGLNVRNFFVAAYNDPGLNTTSGIALFLAMAVASYRTLRWTERRFHGWALLRQMFSIPVSMNALQNAINALKNGRIDAADLDEAAQKTWDNYVGFAHALGIGEASEADGEGQQHAD